MHKQLGKNLQDSCSVEIQEMVLNPSDEQLYSTIQKRINNKQPKALMVFGLESVINIDQLLLSMNQVREEFQKNFHFPIILWMKDEIHRKLIRSIPDFESWGITTQFAVTPDGLLANELLYEIGKKANDIFSQFLQVDAEKFLDELLTKPENYLEIKSVLQDSKLPSKARAKVEFMIARDAYADEDFNAALKKFNKALELWCEKDNQENCQENECDNYFSWQLLLMLHIGLCHCQKIKQPNFQKCVDDCLKFLSQCQNSN